MNDAGFIGSYSFGSEGTFLNHFWNLTLNPGLMDFNNSGGEDDPTVYAETTVNMTNPDGTIYKNVGWDFDTIWEIVPGQNDDYPVLQWQND